VIKINNHFVITVFTVLIPMIFQFIYIRYVSYNVDKVLYGDFVLLQTFISALSLILLQIPSQAYDRFFNTTNDKTSYINEFRTMLIFINIISAFLVVIYGYIMKKFDNEVLVLILFYFFILNNYSFNQKIFLLNLERKKYFYLKVLEAFAKFSMPLIFYYFFHSLISFLIGIVLGYFFSFCFLIKFLKNYPFQLNINWYNYKKYFLFAYPIIFVSIFSWGISFSDRYFIEYLSGTREVAIYSILAQVAGFGQIIGQIYTMYVNPKVLKLYEENKKKGILYLNNMLKKLAFIFIILSFIFYLIPIDIYSILIERSLLEKSYYFWTFYILIIGIFLTVFQTALSMHLILAKKLHVLSYVNGIAFIVNIVGNLWIKEYGIIAAAISTLMAYLVLNVGQIIYISRLFNVKNI
jgi:O-antigen/teichoic acid export membrane protein